LRGVLSAPVKGEADQVHLGAGVRLLQQPGRQHAERHHGDRHGSDLLPGGDPPSAGRLPPLGWTWGPKSKGDITFKAGKNKVVHPLNTDPNAVDLNIQVKISDIHDNTARPMARAAASRASLARPSSIARPTS
jgi:hypothetical protein